MFLMEKIFVMLRKQRKKGIFKQEADGQDKIMEMKPWERSWPDLKYWS